MGNQLLIDLYGVDHDSFPGLGPGFWIGTFVRAYGESRTPLTRLRRGGVARLQRLARINWRTCDSQN
jgi:hypothetical protein